MDPKEESEKENKRTAANASHKMKRYNFIDHDINIIPLKGMKKLTIHLLLDMMGV